MGDSDNVYEVEKILSHKINKGITYYKLKWKGFPMDECTWEKESSLNCPSLLNEYWNSIKSPKKTSESTNFKEMSPQNKKHSKQILDKHLKNGFLTHESTNMATSKKNNTNSLSSVHLKETNPNENNRKDILIKHDEKKKKAIQPQIDKIMKSIMNIEKANNQDKVKSESITQTLNSEYEILAAAKNPKNNSVLYLVKHAKDDQIYQKVVTSEYARKELLQPLINFFLDNLKLKNPI